MCAILGINHSCHFWRFFNSKIFKNGLRQFISNCPPKWLLVRNHAYCHPVKIRKIDKDFARKIDFKDIKFPIKIRHIHKVEKKIVWALVCLVMRIEKNSTLQCYNVDKKLQHD